MEPRDDPFQPKRVDEQIEWLAKSMQEGAQARNQSARLVQRLQNYYMRKRQKDMLKHAWKHIAQRYEDSVLASSGEEHVQNEQRKPGELDQYHIQQERISALQKSMIQPFSQRQTGWKRRLSVFAAILCMILLIGGFLTVFNMIHASHTTSVGSQNGRTLTLQPAKSPASHAIQKALLSDSVAGNSEGVGPGLSGIASQNHFTVGQRIWLSYIWSAEESGTVVVKWYANGHLSSSSSQYMHYEAPYQGRGIAPTPTVSGGIAPTPTASGGIVPTPTVSGGIAPTSGPGSSSVPIESDLSTTYDQPTAGKVELYWKGQLAMTLFFAVSPKA